jgi:L-asparaginase II
MADTYAGGDILVEVSRSDFVESRHHGSVTVLGPDGAPVDEAGDVTGPVFPRSSNKPLQVVGMLRAGLRLTDPADISIASGSHHGEPMHVSRVRAMLAAGDFSETLLGCPADYPLSEQARLALVRAGGQPAPVLMNCSGKHAAMLLTCRDNDWPTSGYLDPAHPVQQEVAAAIAELTGEQIAAVGVDGCGAPVFAFSLRGLAAAFLRLVSAAPGTPELTVADAMRAYPELVSGTGPGAHDTRLMTGIPGLLSKAGAEGVAVAALPGVGAVALKIDDGAARARIPVLASGLARLGVRAAVLDQLTAEERVRGGGRTVGAVRAVW